MTGYLSTIKQGMLNSALRFGRLKRPDRWAILCLLFYTGILFYALHTHIMWRSVNVLLGLIALPVVTVIKKGDTGRFRYAWLAILLSVLCVWLPVKTILYFAIALSVLFVIECFRGSTNLLPLIVISMMSPIFQYMANIFSFQLRLQLTDVAGRAMNVTGSQVTVRGNMIFCKGHEFSVDPACMGLNMLATSLLLQVLLVAVYQKKYGQAASWWQVSLLLVLVTGLNILSNLIRIVCLVQFNIPPATLLHEVTGIVCLLVYVVLPAVLVTRWVVKKYGRLIITGQPVAKSISVRKKIVVHVLLALAMLAAARAVVQRDITTADDSAAVPAVNGYQVQRIAGDVIKLENSRSLVYIKPISGFYSADHNPMICWQGSGYVFTQVEESIINSMPVYVALLQNEKDKLYTAWWYDNGTKRTIDQFTWRWDALQNGTNYATVNVTAVSREKLEEEIRLIQQEHRFNKIL